MSADTADDRGIERSDRFDFERLEQSVEFLLKDHERLTAEREALMAELVDREHRIATIETQLRDERSRRASALEGLDRMLARVESLQDTVATAEQRAHDATEGANP